MVGRRLVGVVPILFGLSVLVFAWVRALWATPPSPWSPGATGWRPGRRPPERFAEVRRLSGLDRPIRR